MNINKPPSLKRSLSLTLITFYGLGNILGAGIYVLVGKVSGHAGYFTPLSFVIAAFIAAFTAFSYAELSARYPESAGEAVYLNKGFNQNWLSTLVGILIVLAGIVSAATISRGFVGYLQIFINLPDWIIILSVLFLLGLISTWSIKQSVTIAATLTLVEIFGLLLVIWAGRENLATIPAKISTINLIPSFAEISGIMSGAFLAFYAYIGFEDMVNVAEEVKKPERNLPIAILLALVLSTVLYALISLVAVTTLTPTELSTSAAPLAAVYETATQSSPLIISFISMFAIVNGILIQFIMAARILYGMGKNSWLPNFLTYIHPKTQTPITATIIVVLITTVFALALPIEALASVTSSLILVIFALVNLALWRIKKHQKVPIKTFSLPDCFPMLAFVVTVAFSGFQLFIWVINLLEH